MVPHERHPRVEDPLLLELAGLYGVLPSYRGNDGREVWSPERSIVSVLRSLGAELPAGEAPPSSADLANAVLTRKLERWRRVVEPIVVAWDGLLRLPVVRLPRSEFRPIVLSLILEDGTVFEWPIGPDGVKPAGGEGVGRAGFAAWSVIRPAPTSWPRRLPMGYHRLELQAGTRRAEAVVIAAPRRCRLGDGDGRGASTGHDPERGAPYGDGVGDVVVAGGRDRARQARRPAWGVFAPLYALRSGRDWGAGDIAELEALADRTGACGGSVVATLPLPAAFLDRPFDPSPYRPVSRMFWNEFYLAVDRTPEWDVCPAARAIRSDGAFRAEMEVLRRGDLVDYRGVMAAKRRVLEELAESFFAKTAGGRREAFVSWLRGNPEALHYGRFRADLEEQDGPDGSPGSGLEGGAVLDSRPLRPAERYHLYCQWQMEEQMASLARGRLDGSARAGLFLDLPLGVHPQGFDTRRWPGLFAREISAGAPPDDFFSLGQRWESPPLHPDRVREDGHRYFAACLRHHMRHADYLRIDHVMSLHRLFWVPRDAAPAAGVYVSYPAEESYAVACLESHVNHTVMVGEDLGTVPPEVRPAMRRHGVLRTWVAQASFRARAADPLGAVPPGVVAGVNTHDMFPFAGFLAGLDIEMRLGTGQVDEGGARREAAARRRLVEKLRRWAEQEVRERPGGAADGPAGWEAVAYAAPDRAAVKSAAPDGPAPESPAPGSAVIDARILRAVLARLMESRAGLALVNLEDLWLETRPQNVPGAPERPNWRRKTRCRMDAFDRD